MISKILLVFTAVVSVLLAGVSMVAFFAVPNMGLAMDQLDDYTFEAQYGEKTTWNVTHRLGDKASLTPKELTPYDAVLKARDDLKRSLQAESGEMTARLTVVETQLQQHQKEQVEDVQAMLLRGEELGTVEATYEKQVKDVSGEFQDLSVKARMIRDETASRRQDVTRLRAELEELRTHQFELQALRRTLVDQLLRIQLDNQNLEQRQDQIRQLAGS